MREDPIFDQTLALHGAILEELEGLDGRKQRLTQQRQLVERQLKALRPGWNADAPNSPVPEKRPGKRVVVARRGENLNNNDLFPKIIDFLHGSETPVPIDNIMRWLKNSHNVVLKGRRPVEILRGRMYHHKDMFEFVQGKGYRLTPFGESLKGQPINGESPA